MTAPPASVQFRCRPMTGLCLALLLTGAAPAPAVPVRGAEVTAASAGTDILLKRPRQFPVPLRAGETINDRVEIEVPARSRSWAELTAIPSAMEARLVGSARRTTWQLPCVFTGDGFISWSGAGQRGCSPPGVVIRGGGSRSAGVLPTRVDGPSIAAAGPLLAQGYLSPGSFFSACSATNASGAVARTAATVTPLGLLGGAAAPPCEQALADCDAAAGAGGSCGVVSEVRPGEWTPESVAFTQCDGQLGQHRGWESLLLLLRPLTGGTLACSFNVLGPDDALLLPQEGQRTTVAFEGNRRGAVISVIEGTAHVVSQASGRWVAMATGETYDSGSGQKQPTRRWLAASNLCQDADDDDREAGRRQTTTALADVAARWSSTCRSTRTPNDGPIPYPKPQSGDLDDRMHDQPRRPAPGAAAG